ncbi:MAG: copper amine oxidase N-terminal domain-containing protein [Thermincolia bacterium]
MKKTLIIALLVILVFAGAAYASIETVKVYVNGREVKTDVPAQIINGRTMVPLRAVSESLGADVKWDEVNRAVNITKQPSGPITGHEWNIIFTYKAIFQYYDIMETIIGSLGTSGASNNLVLYYSKLSGNPNIDLLNRSREVLSSFEEAVNYSQEYIDFLQRILPPTNSTNEAVMTEMKNTKIKLQSFIDRDKIIKDEIAKYYNTGDVQDGKKAVEDSKSLLSDIMNYEGTVKNNKKKNMELMDQYINKASTK